jgi:hypothetical protein
MNDRTHRLSAVGLCRKTDTDLSTQLPWTLLARMSQDQVSNPNAKACSHSHGLVHRYRFYRKVFCLFLGRWKKRGAEVSVKEEIA